MTGTKEATMANDSARPAGPGFLWPAAIVVAASALSSVISKQAGAQAQIGGALPGSWLGPIVAILFAVVALALLVFSHREGWRAWSARRRLYWISLVSSLGFGAGLGLSLQASNIALFSNDPLAQTMALALAGLWVIGILAASILYSRSVDDHERQAYYLASVAGFHFFLLACPAWWVLARAAILPPVDAMWLFVASTLVHLVVYLWFKFR